MNREDAIKALDVVGDVAMAVHRGGGLIAAPALIVASILKSAANAMRRQNDTVDDILAKIRMPRHLTMPWDAQPVAPEETAHETPRSKQHKE